MLFMTFHGPERSRSTAITPMAPLTGTTTTTIHAGTPHESPWVVTVPLILLAIPSVYAGWAYIERCCSAASSATRSSLPSRTLVLARMG
jgi:NADH-quinone oxidoreductase subunit L